MVVDWTKLDQDVFTTNGNKSGWCNVDPDEAYTGKVQFKGVCECQYDGLGGWFCEVSVQSTCINQCSGHGHCRGGFCQVILLFIKLFTRQLPLVSTFSLCQPLIIFKFLIINREYYK